jgi:hypothetical protein
MRTLLLVTLLLSSACKKKDDKPAAPPAGSGTPPPAQVADAAVVVPEPPPEAPPPPPPPPPVVAVKIADNKDYDAKATDFTERMVALIAGAKGKDCATLAAEITKFAEDNRGLTEGLQAFSKANPAAKKAFGKKMKPRQKEFDKKIGPVLEACQDDVAVQQAVQLIPQ